MIMMMPPYHGALLKAGPQGIIEHFTVVAEAAGVPIMVQDAPLGVDLSIDLLVRMAARCRVFPTSKSKHRRPR